MIAVGDEAVMLLCNWSLVCLTGPQCNESRGKKTKEKALIRRYIDCVGA